MNKEAQEQAIAIHVGCPGVALFRAYCPDGNWIGMAVLRRLLELALMSEGLIQEGKISGIGELNDSVFRMIVVDEAAALERVKRELESVALLDRCQIAILEGHRWLCIHPSAAIRMEWLLDTERHGLAVKQAIDGVVLEHGQLVDQLINQCVRRNCPDRLRVSETPK